MEEILEQIEQKHYSKVKKMLADMLIPDVAELLERIESDTDMVIVFRLLPKSLGAEVFSYISPEWQETLIQLLSDKEIAYIIEDMYTDDVVDFIDELPAKQLCAGNKDLACLPLYYEGDNEDDLAADKYAICVTKGQEELLAAINEVLSELLADVDENGVNGVQKLVNKHLGIE